jgi:hypothetical protein
MNWILIVQAIVFCVIGSTYCEDTLPCDSVKTIARAYASHSFEKQKYFNRGILLATFIPVVGPVALEIGAVTKKLLFLKALRTGACDSTLDIKCFNEAHTKKVKSERAFEALKGALLVQEYLLLFMV